MNDEQKTVKDVVRRSFPVIIVLVLCCLMFTLAAGYVRPVEAHGVKFKFYDNSLDADQCMQQFQYMPEEYLEGVNTILLRQENDRYLGRYYWFTGNIDLYGNCDINTIIHELAHHCQKKSGDYLMYAMQHTGCFDECEEEIHQAFYDQKLSMLMRQINEAK